MKLRAPRWFLWTAAAVLVFVAVLATVAWFAARHFEPFVREQAILYLQDKFGTGVELGKFNVSVTVGSLWRLETAVVRVTGDRLVLPFPGKPNLRPLVKVGKFRLQSPLSALWKTPRRVRDVRIDQVEINIPPRERRPPLIPQSSDGQQKKPAAVEVGTIHATSLELNIFPADPDKEPRVFEIHDLLFKSTGAGQPMHYEAKLTNPTPPGEILATGTFGPWQREDPGATPLTGEYKFNHADLGVFHKIAGILDSTGKFQGVLERLEVDGETRTPDFRLTGGNPVPLNTRYHSIVDGTSGDTYLQPVDATLGGSRMIARGGVTRPKGSKRRTVELDVVMTDGRIEDIMRLAVKGNKPLMTGGMNLKTKLRILPVAGDFNQRLLLAGTVEMEKAHFTAAKVQDKIDSLSRRAQGQPDNEEISDVLSSIISKFHMHDGNINFSSLTFHTPGAAVHLKGTYGIYSEQVDLHGIARLHAKLSQTMTGWKRLALKVVDPFFSKAGAGTLLPIKITGTREHPDFGLDRNNDDKTASADRSK